VRSLHDFLVDRIDFLPEVFRQGIGEGGGGIYVPRDLENACADCGKDRFDDPDDAVVERVHGASRPGFANASRHQRLDVRRFDLHVDRRPVAYGVERFSKSRNARPVGQREFPELRFGELLDCSARGPLRMPGVDDRIVVNDDHPVASRVDVELNAIGAQFDGAFEGCNRILRMSLVRPPVGDALGGIAASTCGQAFLSVVALGR
jgi:hypothetical protein